MKFEETESGTVIVGLKEAIRAIGLTYKNKDGSIGAISDATESDPNMLFYNKAEADAEIADLRKKLARLVEAALGVIEYSQGITNYEAVKKCDCTHCTLIKAIADAKE